LKVSEQINIKNTTKPKKTKNSSLFSTPKLLENKNNLFKIKFVSIRPGFDKTAMKGKIEATPIISKSAIMVTIKSNKNTPFLS
jgi:hypothetical protein